MHCLIADSDFTVRSLLEGFVFPLGILVLMCGRTAIIECDREGWRTGVS